MALRRIPEEFLNRIARDRRVSDGELAALKLALTQRKSKDIAKQLEISETAARKRLGEVYRKFGIKGRGPGKLASLEKTLEAGYKQSCHEQVHDLYRPAAETNRWNDTGAGTTYYWNNAPTLSAFEGRSQPLAALKEWMNLPAKGIKLLAVCGIGGIGKTHLVRKLAEDVGSDFEVVVWLKLDKAEPPEDLLRSLQKMLQAAQSTGQSTALASPAHEPIGQVIEQIVDLMSQRRSFVVLDKFDAAFKSYLTDKKRPSDETLTVQVSRQQQASLYAAEFKVYGKLLAAIKQSDGRSELSPKSCLILTSREKPKELLSFSATDAGGKLYTLAGLGSLEATKMLNSFQLVGNDQAYWDLADHYHGHPMALRLAANTIKDVFDGSIQDFLDQNIFVFDDLRGILKAQFNKLPPAEQEAMYWLAINSWPCSLDSLRADIVSQDHKQNLLYTLRSLERRSLVQIDKSQPSASVSFYLHPIVAEYVLDRFIRAVFQDLVRGDLALFNAYALMKADAEEDLRSHQIKTIVQPILVRLKNHYKSLNAVDKHLSEKLGSFRHDYPGRLGYAGGNFLNLLVQLSQGTLRNKDFSKLTIWQAYLQGTQMRAVNFSQCALNRSVFTETLSDVLSVALRPQGIMRSLCAGDTNGFVHLWDMRSREQEGAREGGEKQTDWLAHQSWVRAVAFVPKQRRLVTGGDDCLLKLWRLPAVHSTGHHSDHHSKQSTGKIEQVWQQSSKDRIYAVAVSSDGKIIASGGDDKIALYHTRTGNPINCTLKQSTNRVLCPVGDESQNQHQSTQNNRVRSLSFSADGRWLASCGDDGAIRLWAVKDISRAASQTGQAGQTITPIDELTGHQGLVCTVRFSPDGTRLISGGIDERIVVFEIADVSGDAPVFKHLRTLRNAGGNVRTLAISPDGDYFASGGDGAQVRLWDMDTLTCIKTLSTQTSRIWSLDFQQLGDRLLLSAGGDKQQLMLWQIFRPKDKPEPKTEHTVASRLLRTYRGYTNSLRSVAYLSDRTIVGGGDSGSLGLWDTQTGDRTATLSRHHGRIWSVAVDAKNARMASASDDSTIRLWDAATGQELNMLTGHRSWVRAIAFSRHGRFLASAGDDGTLRIWNPLSGGCLKIIKGSGHWIHAVSFSPTNSRYVVTGGDEQVVRHWDRKDETVQICARHQQRVCSVDYSPNGKLIASGSDDATVVVWDITKHKAVHCFNQPMLGIKAVAFSPNGKYLAAGGEDQVVYVWDLEAANPKERCLELWPQEYTGLAGGIRSVTFSPNSRYVISGGLDEMIRQGDLQQMDELGALGDLDAGVLTPLIQRDRPYENIEIKGIKGLNNLQMANLVTLGAVSHSKSLLL